VGGGIGTSLVGTDPGCGVIPVEPDPPGALNAFGGD